MRTVKYYRLPLAGSVAVMVLLYKRIQENMYICATPIRREVMFLRAGMAYSHPLTGQVMMDGQKCVRLPMQLHCLIFMINLWIKRRLCIGNMIFTMPNHL